MIKKSVFYIAVALLIFGGQFFFNRGLVTGTPPLITEKILMGNVALPPIAKGPSIIYFWAEWCGICNMMKDSVDSVLQEYPGMTVAVRSGNDGKVNSFMQQYQLNWHVVNDANGEIADRYGIKGVPVAFFLNKNGEIVFSSVGFSSELGLRFRLWLVGLL